MNVSRRSLAAVIPSRKKEKISFTQYQIYAVDRGSTELCIDSVIFYAVTEVSVYTISLEAVYVRRWCNFQAGRA